MKVLIALVVAIAAAMFAPLVPSRPDTGGFANAHSDSSVSCASDFGRCQRAVMTMFKGRNAAPERGVTITERPGGSNNPFTVMREVSDMQRKAFQDVQRQINR